MAAYGMAGMKLCLLFALFGFQFATGAQLMGGYTHLNLNNNENPEWSAARDFYFDETNGARKRLNPLPVDVSTQLVNGLNYRFTFAVLDENGKDTGATCDVVVYVPFEFTHLEKKVTSDECAAQLRQARSKRQVGAEEKIDLKSAEAAKIADFGVKKENLQSNSLNLFKVTSITSITKQTVSGVKYTIDYRVQATGCRKNHPVELSSCSVNSDGEVLECHSVVLEQLWMSPPRHVLEHSCKPVATQVGKNKRSLGGDGHDIGNYGAFQVFKKQYGRVYADDQEEKARFAIFRDNMRLAAKIQQTEKGTARYGATKFADVSKEEFERYYTSGQWDLSYNPALKPAQIPADPAPEAYDWRNHSAVTEVKNQGMCGSCWAFSTTGNIEGQWAIKKKQLVSLSEQELVDCDKIDEGCNGGLPSNAYQEIIRLGGLETETKYPYDGKDESCHFKVGDVKVYINGSLNISTDEADMASWLAKNGPISIGINANAMQFYLGGISHPWKIFCNPNNLDHGVLIVGYGVQDNTPYWIVKNSWGKTWGEKGYYLVYRGSGVCGLNKMPTSATIG